MKKALAIFFTGFFFASAMAQAPADTTFDSYSVTLKTPTGDIQGTLTVSRLNAKTPVVIIVPASGNVDMNGNTYYTGITPDMYKLLAEELAHHGISSLRYDKRGVGHSYQAVKPNTELKFEDHVKDVTAWIAYLKQAPEFYKVIVLGHNEGSLIGMIAANRSGKAASLISVDGSAVPIDQLLRQSLQNRTPEMVSESNRILDSLKAGLHITVNNPDLKKAFPHDVQTYLISWMKYEPVKEIRALQIPVMIVQGKEDMENPPLHGLLLSKARPDARLVLIDKMNYVLKDVEGDANENKASYKKPDLPVSEDLVDALVDFIHP